MFPADPMPNLPPESLAHLKAIIAARANVPSGQHEKILRFCLSNEVEVSLASISEIAKSCDCSVSVISRLSKRLGRHDFREFRDLFRTEIRARSQAASC